MLERDDGQVSQVAVNAVRLSLEIAQIDEGLLELADFLAPGTEGHGVRGQGQSGGTDGNRQREHCQETDPTRFFH